MPRLKSVVPTQYVQPGRILASVLSVFYLCPKSAVHEKYRRVGSNSSLPYAMDSELTRSISDPGGEEAANPQYFQPDPGDACLTRGQAVFCFVISNIMLFH